MRDGTALSLLLLLFEREWNYILSDIEGGLLVARKILDVRKDKMWLDSTFTASVIVHHITEYLPTFIFLKSKDQTKILRLFIIECIFIWSNKIKNFRNIKKNFETIKKIFVVKIKFYCYI